MMRGVRLIALFAVCTFLFCFVRSFVCCILHVSVLRLLLCCPREVAVCRAKRKGSFLRSFVRSTIVRCSFARRFLRLLRCCRFGDSIRPTKQRRQTTASDGKRRRQATAASDGQRRRQADLRTVDLTFSIMHHNLNDSLAAYVLGGPVNCGRQTSGLDDCRLHRVLDTNTRASWRALGHEDVGISLKESRTAAPCRA